MTTELLQESPDALTILHTERQSTVRASDLISSALSGVGLLAVLALARYTGGLGLALVFAGVVSIAGMLVVAHGSAAHTAVVAGFTTILGWMFVLTVVVVPILTFARPIRPWFFDSEPMNFVARSHLHDGSLELRRWVVLLALGAPSLASAGWVAARPRRLAPHCPRRFLPVIGLTLLASVPLVAAAWLKATDPYRLLAPTMSGDGRNFLLAAQRIRVDSDFQGLTGVLNQVDFSPSFSAILSKAAGANGLFQIADQYAIAATYLFAASLIVASTAFFGAQFAGRIVAPARGRDGAVVVAGAVISGLAGAYVASNPWTMNEVFRSGFLSLYFAFALTALWVAYLIGMNAAAWTWWAGVCITLLLLFSTYQPAALLPGAVTVIYAVPFCWSVVRSQYRLVVPAILVVGLLVWWTGAPASFVDMAQNRVMIPGAITPTSHDFLWLMVPIGLGFALTSVGHLRRLGVTLVSIPLGSWAFLRFVTRVRESRGEESSGYYGEKFVYLALFLTIVCALAIIVHLLVLVTDDAPWPRVDRTSKIRFVGPIRRAAVVVLVGMGLLWAGVSTAPESTILAKARSGWDQPPAWIARQAVEHWDSGNAVFLQIADPGNDRMANFWSPLFWSGDTRWAWVYGDFSYEPEIVCNVMAPGPVTLVTKSQEYANSLLAACPEVFGDVEVLN